MWMPFTAGGGNSAGAQSVGGGAGADKPASNDKELDALRRQLSEMQKTLDTIVGRKPG